MQIARRAAELGNARDWDALFELIDPDIEWRDQMHAPDVPEVLHGIEQLRGLIGQWDAAYETFTVEALEYIGRRPVGHLRQSLARRGQGQRVGGRGPFL